jgi:small subunit ribosomal protein S6
MGFGSKGFAPGNSIETEGRPMAHLYEHIFMARQDVSAQAVEALIEQYKGIIETGGGTVGKVEYWGVKSLAYRIKKNRKAHYSLMNIACPPAAIAEMERQMRLSEDVLRFITIRVEEHEDGPSAMLQKRERDERRDRERFGDDRPPRRRDEEEVGEEF